jgi:hypothetical protein
MAPSLKDICDLKDLVNQLQDRINKIERSMKGGEEATTSDRVRMILMGPPGAGTVFLLFTFSLFYVFGRGYSKLYFTSMFPRLTVWLLNREGNSSTENQG